MNLFKPQISLSMDSALYAFIVVMWALDIKRIYLFWRQYKTISYTDTIPPVLVGYAEPEAFETARLSMKRKCLTSVFSIAFRILSRTFKIMTYGFATAWSATSQFSHISTNRAIIYNIQGYLSIRLPLIPIVALIVIITGQRTPSEAANNMFLELLQLLFETILSALTTYALISYIERFSAFGFLYICPISIACGIVFTLMYVEVVVPTIHDKLHQGPLYDRLSQLTREMKFSMSKVYVERRTTAELDRSLEEVTNAYYCGVLGFNMVILSNKLVSEFNDDEVCAIVAHELGHWHRMHTSLYFIMTAVELFFVCLSLYWSYGNEWLLNINGFDLVKDPPHPIMGTFLYVGMIYPVYKQATSLITTQISRKCEFSADQFAVDVGQARYLKQALLKLTVKTNPFPVYDNHYSKFLLHHPPLMDRLARIDDRIR